MFQRPAPAENAQKFQQITQIPHNSPTAPANYVKFAPIIDPFTLCFRYLLRQRTLRNSCKFCKFHTICPQLPRITQNSHHLLIHYILCSRCLTSGRELPKITANQAKFAQFAHMQNLFNSPTYSTNDAKFALIC